MLGRIASLIRRAETAAGSYSRELQAARVRASYQRAYFAPALFSLVPVQTDLIASMAVDVHWRLYYNESWVASHTVEENAAVLIHEVGHLLRDHESRRKSAAAADTRLWNTVADCEINDDLVAEGLSLPGDPPLPGDYGLDTGDTAEVYYSALFKPPQTGPKPPQSAPAPDIHDTPPMSSRAQVDCGSGAHGERRPWELPEEAETSGGTAGVDAVKAEIIRREVAQQIMDRRFPGDVPLRWRRWAHAMLTPQVDYMAIIRHAVRKGLRESTLGQYDRTYRHPHRRQAAYGDFIMPTFYQPRPRPGFLIDTSGSMQNAQLARAVTELAGLTRQLGYGAEVVVACCDAAVHDVRKVFTVASVELYGAGGTDMGIGLQWFVERRHAIDLLIVVTDCHSAWPATAPPFPVITIRVGDGVPAAWGEQDRNQVITIEEPTTFGAKRAPRAGT